MSVHINLYTRQIGSKEILEKYILNTSINDINPFLDNFEEEYGFINFNIEKNDMLSLYGKKLCIFDNIIIPEDDYNSKLIKYLEDIKILNMNTEIVTEILKNVPNKNMKALFYSFMESLHTYYLLKNIIKTDFPYKYIIIGPGGFINQIIPLFIIDNINTTNNKWQIIIFEPSICDEDKHEDASKSTIGCVGNYIKNYINEKIIQNKQKNLEILVIDGGYVSGDFGLSYLLLPFVESTIEKVIINDTLGSGAKSPIKDYKIIDKIIPNFIKNYIKTNIIIYYASGSTFKTKIIYYNILNDEIDSIHTVKPDTNFNCTKNYKSETLDGRCPLDFYPIDIVLNNGFHTLRQNTNDYDQYILRSKYLKYKSKYLNLKMLIR